MSKLSRFALSAAETGLVQLRTQTLPKCFQVMSKVPYKYGHYQAQKIRSNQATKWKFRMGVVQHMFYGSFGTKNLMVAFIFKFALRKDQRQVKLGQIRSNFPIQNLLTKTCLSCSVLFQDSKMFFIFIHDNQKCLKLHFKKWRHHICLYYLSFTIARLKANKLLRNFGCVLFVWCLQHLILFGMTSKFCILWALKQSDFLGQNIAISKIWHDRFVQSSILRLLSFLDCVLF